MSSKKEQSPSMTAAKYADILHLARPKPSHLHPRMQVENRAKIFSPFAALRGYEEEIAEEGIEGTEAAEEEPDNENFEESAQLEEGEPDSELPEDAEEEEELPESEEETGEIA